MFKTREDWLKEAVKVLRPRVAKHGKMPEKIEALVGWPKGSPKAIGQQFPTAWTKGKASYVFISPTQDEPGRVLDILLHELIHTLGFKGHGPEFKAVALALGLTGKMRATVAGEELKAELEKIAKKLGAYPHVKMEDMKEHRQASDKKSQVRFVSPDAAVDFTAWVSVKQASEIGAPICPVTKKPMIESR